MKSKSILFSALLTLTLSHECLAVTGSGKAGKEDRKVPAFHGICIMLPAQLEAKQGAPGPLTIEADDNILPYIKTEVKDGILYIDSKESLQTRSKMSFKVSSSKLDQLQSKGTCTAKVSDLKGAEFKASSSGTASMSISGEVGKFISQIDGTGTVDSSKLKAKAVVIDIKGTGTAKVDASESLDATIKGTGTVKYSGNPKVKQSIFGLGNVSKI